MESMEVLKSNFHNNVDGKVEHCCGFKCVGVANKKKVGVNCYNYWLSSFCSTNEVYSLDKHKTNIINIDRDNGTTNTMTGFSST